MDEVQYKIKDFPDSKEKHAEDGIKLLIKVLQKVGKLYLSSEKDWQKGLKTYQLAGWYADQILLEGSKTRDKAISQTQAVIKQFKIKLELMRHETMQQKLDEVAQAQIKNELNKKSKWLSDSICNFRASNFTGEVESQLY